MTCRTGCPTQDHASYAACLRMSGVRIAYANSAGDWDYTKQKKWDRELQGYRDATAEGLNPSGTTWSSIDRARRAADAVGVPVEV